MSKLLGVKGSLELLTSRLAACGAVTLSEGSSHLRWLELKSSREIRRIPSDPAPRTAIVSRLRFALQAGGVGNPWNEAGIALVHACRIADVFKGHDLREARKRVNDVVKADPIAWAVSRAVNSEIAADGGLVGVV